ncbi:Uncharacterised protein [Mycobacteroides abscessus subsp. abscessus]|nr:Uncharacterised protein [Mycobacteroides abscessus subsp. abscessus]
MLDDEPQIGVVGGDLVDVGHVEGITVERPDRRSLVHVDVADSQFEARLQIAPGPGVVELVPARIAVPLGRIQLDALQVHPLRVSPQLLQARLFVARIVGMVVGEPPGILLDQSQRLVGLAETPVVELVQERGLEDRVVDVALHEEIAFEPGTAVIGVGVVVPDRIGRAQVLVVVVEAVDELLSVHVLLVRLAGVPDMDVAVHDEVLVAVLLIHGNDSDVCCGLLGLCMPARLLGLLCGPAPSPPRRPHWAVRSKPMYSAASSGLANRRVLSSRWTIRP